MTGQSAWLRGMVLAATLLGGGVGGGGAAFAQTEIPPVVSRDNLTRDISAAFDRDDFTEAARLLDIYLNYWPGHPTMLYNAACAYAQLGDEEKAADFLWRSVEQGFTDFGHMARDPDLHGLRGHPVYVKLMEARDEAYSRLAGQQLDRAREQFGDEGYYYEVDEEHRLTYAVSLDPVAFREMQGMLAAQADQLIETLFDGPPDYYVLIAVPTPHDAQRVIRDRTIGGIYEHGRRRLVARDIGSMLRHEFTHVMHYGHMSRIRQPHALWVQEGIAALYESYHLDDEGVITFLPNNRHNIIRMAVRSERDYDWSELLNMSSERFMSQAGRTYPQVRSIFRWLADEGRLGQWYRAYVATFEEDRSGEAAFRMVFNEPLEDTEQRWRDWLMAQPMRDEVVRTGDASLGIRFTPGARNDGVQIGEIIDEGAAQEAGLQAGDIIVAIDDHPTRAHVELIEIIAAREVGDHVRVRYRRGEEYRVALVTLKPLPFVR